MSKCILYPANATVAVISPAPNCGLTIEQIAIKDVPNGTPFLIVDKAEMPTGRANRDLWTADFSNPTGHGGQA